MAGPPLNGDNLQRQFDEIEAMEAILGCSPEWHTSAPKLAVMRAAAPGGSNIELPSECQEQGADDDRGQDSVATKKAAEVDVAFATKVAGGDAELRFRLPAGYPATTPPDVTAGCWQLSKAAEADLARACSTIVAAAVAETPGEELLLTVVQEVIEHLERLLTSSGAGDAQHDAAADNGGGGGDAEWRRCFFWVDHLLHGKQHKKERDVLAELQSTGLPGKLWYGRPGVVALEGPQSEVDAAARACGKAGKALRIKKSMAMPNGRADSYFPHKFVVVASSKGDGLDVDDLHADVVALGLEHKYRFILGLEQLP
jgi:hypothetical protein